MTGFQVFLAGFLLGAVPGPFIILVNILRALSSGRLVQKIALEERRFSDPIFELSSGSSRMRVDYARKPETLLCDDDSERLRKAKLAMISERPRILRNCRHAVWLFLLGAPSGALLGHYLAIFLGLTA